MPAPDESKKIPCGQQKVLKRIRRGEGRIVLVVSEGKLEVERLATMEKKKLVRRQGKTFKFERKRWQKSVQKNTPNTVERQRFLYIKRRFERKALLT